NPGEESEALDRARAQASFALATLDARHRESQARHLAARMRGREVSAVRGARDVAKQVLIEVADHDLAVRAALASDLAAALVVDGNRLARRRAHTHREDANAAPRGHQGLGPSGSGQVLAVGEDHDGLLARAALGQEIESALDGPAQVGARVRYATRGERAQ